MNFILKNWVKYYTKEVAKALKISAFGAIIIIAVIAIKYKPVYKVDLNGEDLGYIKSKENLELKITDYMNDITGNIAFKEQVAIPSYKLAFVNRLQDYQEDEILTAIEDSTITTYRTYAVTVDGNIQTSVSSEEDANSIVDEMKAGVDEKIDLGVGIIEQYTTEFDVQSKEEASGILNSIKVAKVEEYNKIQEEKRKKEQEEARRKIISQKTVQSVGTIAGISLSKPISGGIISSRFGSRSSSRSSTHTGLDIAIASGTPVAPIAPGTVTFAGYKGSYGNLVIVNHGNGIESYYAHCSEIYCSVGQHVDSKTLISAVGSTGNSTGPHLHLEIRENGTSLNPENYLY